jgi:hypothetical protein
MQIVFAQSQAALQDGVDPGSFTRGARERSYEDIPGRQLSTGPALVFNRYMKRREEFFRAFLKL